jgi:hypothetical protein
LRPTNLRAAAIKTRSFSTENSDFNTVLLCVPNFSSFLFLTFYEVVLIIK